MHSGESFVTVVARVWLFASVGHLMVLQLLIGPELFVTVRALIVPRRSTRVVWSGHQLNSILLAFCYQGSFQLVYFRNTQSTIVFNGVLGPPRLVHHTWWWGVILSNTRCKVEGP